MAIPSQPVSARSRLDAITNRALAGQRPAKAVWKPAVEGWVRELAEHDGHGLDAELREALGAAYTVVRAYLRLTTSVPFLVADVPSYRELAGIVHEAAERLQRAYLRVDVRLRRGGASGSLLAVVNDARKMRAATPLDPPSSPADYRHLLTTLDAMGGTAGHKLFQRRGGVSILEAVVNELSLIPHAPEPAVARMTPTRPVNHTLQRQLADGLRALAATGVTSIGKIMAHLKSPAGADLRALAEGVLAKRPKKKGSDQTRKLRDVVEAAVVMHGRDKKSATS